MLNSTEKARLIEMYEPIIYFHSDEPHIPQPPWRILERSAMWVNQPVAKNMHSWGNGDHDEDTPFPRQPLIPHGAISINPNEADDPDKVYIGEQTDDGFDQYLVSNDSRQLFLQMLDNAWVGSGPDTDFDLSAEVGATGVPLTGIAQNYYCDVRDQDSIGAIPLAGDTQIPPGWQLAMQSLYPRGFWLLTFYFLYDYHEETLTDCENDMEEVRARRAGDPLPRMFHGSYPGDWQAVCVLVPNPGQTVAGAPSGVPPVPASPLDLAEDEFPEPEYAGFSRRARGAVTNITANVIEARDFTFMPVAANAANEIKLLGNHLKVFVSRGTHNNYPLPGTMTAPKADAALPFGIEFINACLAADNFDTLFEEADDAREKADEVKRQARVIAISLGKIIGAGILGALGGPAGIIVGVVLGGFAAVAEGLGGAGPDTLPPFDPGGPEEVPDAGPSSEEHAGLVLAPPSVAAQVADEAGEAANVQAFNEAWALRLVNRDNASHIWWPPDGTHPRGYSGLWGVVSERDPFNRRSGTAMPLFEAAFINSLLTERG